MLLIVEVALRIVDPMIRRRFSSAVLGKSANTGTLWVASASTNVETSPLEDDTSMMADARS
jgi:hypothetical protein